MTNVEALKEVYIALGGSAEDFTATTNDEAIALIASVAGGGGGGGSDDLFYVHFNYSDDTGYVTDKTFAEAISASVNGKIVAGISFGGLFLQRRKSYEDDEEIELYQVPVVQKDSSATSDKNFTIMSSVITWNIDGNVSIGGADLHITGN